MPAGKHQWFADKVGAFARDVKKHAAGRALDVVVVDAANFGRDATSWGTSGEAKLQGLKEEAGAQPPAPTAAESPGTAVSTRPGKSVPPDSPYARPTYSVRKVSRDVAFNPDITYAARPPAASEFTRAELEGLSVAELRAEAKRAGIARLPLRRVDIVDTLLDHGGLQDAEQTRSTAVDQLAARKRSAVHAENEARAKRILGAAKRSSLRSRKESPAGKRAWRDARCDADLARTPEFRRLTAELTGYGVSLVPIQSQDFNAAQRDGNIFVPSGATGSAVPRPRVFAGLPKLPWEARARNAKTKAMLCRRISS